MPEAIMMCIDSSEYMRNGDYFPSRMMATQDSASVILSSKLSSNPENTIGFMCMGGQSCTMRETLTGDLERVMASLTKITIGGKLHFTNAIQIATLALSYRSNPRSEKRILAFVGSPVVEDERVLEQLAKKLRKDHVAVDIISFGEDSNKEILEKFINTVNKQQNSHILHVPRGSSISDCLYTHPILLGNDAAAANAGGTSGHAGGSGGFEFGVDPNIDPELARALRMSAEDERHRIERLANGGESSTIEGDDTAAPSRAPFIPDVPMTEEEELELAIRLSMQDAEDTTRANEQPSGSGAPHGSTAQVDPGFDAALEDPDFMKQLDAELNQDVDINAQNLSKKDNDESKQ
eukprot:Tbor_TRINITY_DN3168_c0_g1::TRINITY_DN3168_c0_g1_i1::g.14624::m.14624/K03029/PSMD4, RPN10; 26S proteasome regulatory subunit N10